MSSLRYGEYSPDRAGWFWGLSGAQLGLLAGFGVPALVAFNTRAWVLFGTWLPVWGLLAVLVVVPVRGRPAARWLGDLVRYAIGAVMGWTSFRSKVATGAAADLTEADLPGVLAGIRTHDGPPFGQLLSRPVIVQDLAARTWAAVASISHPGIGLAEPDERARMADGLAELCEIAARTELIDVLAVQVRTVPDDGAERAAWEAAHTRAGAPPLAVQVNELLARTLTPAAVRTESFVAVVVPESKIGKAAKAAGGGVAGRARVLHGVMGEVEAALRGPVGCSDVRWLDSQALAEAVRTGFAPGDRAQLTAAALAAVDDPGVATGVPVAAAGPSRAYTPPRHYCHDAWASVTCTVLLPEQGAVLGALAPVFVPTVPGERRSVTVFLAPMSLSKATRMVDREEMSASAGTEMKSRLGFRQRARDRRDTGRLDAAEEKLAAGRALVRPAVAACVTVPAGWAIGEHGDRLQASIRGAGYVPQLLDLAQDAGFAAAAVPLGVGLPQGRRR